MTDFAQKDEDLGGPADLGLNADPAPDVAPQMAAVPHEVPRPPDDPILPPPDDDAGFGDVFEAAAKDERIRTDAWGYSRHKRNAFVDEMYGKLSTAGKKSIGDEWRRGYEAGGWPRFSELVVDAAAREAKSAPEVAKTWGAYPLTTEDLDRRIDDERRAELEAARRVLDQDGGAVAEFLGASWTAMTDETSLLTLPLGGGSGAAWKMIAREALAGAVGEAMILPREMQVSEELGIEKPDAVSRIGLGAILGGGLAALGHGVGKAVGLWHGHRDGIRAVAPDGDELDAEVRIDAEEARLRGDQTVQERVGPKVTSDPAPGTMGDILGTPPAGAAGLPRVGPGAPEGWSEIRNGIFVGESGGDYNALFGFQNRKGGKFSRVKLTEMTVDQAIAFSDPKGEYGQWVKGKIGRVATPMGAYQIVGTTLRAAKHALGLRGNEVMTPDLQEELGHWIYRTQGTGAWEGYKGPRKSFVPVDASAEVPSFGPTSRGYTGSGQVTAGDDFRIDVEYEVVDASTLTRASGDFQPRDRSRIASDAWIADTAARLDPAQLMPSPTADRGAPIVGPDGMIESGNGRFGAILRAYEKHPDRAVEYRSQIEAAGYAVPEGVARPVLVARRKSDLSREDRVRFTVAAQDSGVAVMTPTEVARASSRAMTPDVLARMDPTQPIRAEGNGDFVRSALAALPRSARNAMFDAGGMLNSAGERQLREALFARAWPDPDILARYTEGNAAELKSLMEALETAAPSWATLRADIEAGRVAPEMDIGGHVLDALRLIGAARELAASQKVPIVKAIAELLDEVDLIEGAISPLTAALVRKFWKNGRAAPADEVGSFLSRYADEARKAGATGGMFDAPGPRDVLVTIDRATFGDLPEDFGAARGYATPAGREPAALPDQGFDQGAASPEAEAADTAMRAELEADGPFGPILTGFKDDWRGAVDALVARQSGEAPGALHHPEAGPISLVWGHEGTGRGDGAGLAKILKYHPEVLDDLQGRLDRATTVISKSENRIRLASDTDNVVIRLDHDGEKKTWLLTAYERETDGKAQRSANRITGRAGELPEGSSPSAPLQSKDSADPAPDQAPIADPVAAGLQRLREDYADLEIDIDGTTFTARELLDDLDADEAADAVVQACGIIPTGGA